MLCNRLRPTGCRPPLLCGLPNIHKLGIPLRPIVYCIGSPSSNVSKFISNMMISHQSNIKNSTHFMQTVSSVCLRSDKMMVSFDVSSLFTNVPIDEAVSVIRDKLQNDESLECLSPVCITELLEVCLWSTYFRYNRNCCEQVDGAAMGPV